jgi:hypothetical protein
MSKKNTKALPPAPFVLIMKRISKSGPKINQNAYSEAMENWPKWLDKISDRDMTGCISETGQKCHYPNFLGVHFPKIAKILNQIRDNKGLERSDVNCIPLNYHWMNEEVQKLRVELGLEDNVPVPFLISEVLYKETINLKIYLNILVNL